MPDLLARRILGLKRSHDVTDGGRQGGRAASQLVRYSSGVILAPAEGEEMVFDRVDQFRKQVELALLKSEQFLQSGSDTAFERSGIVNNAADARPDVLSVCAESAGEVGEAGLTATEAFGFNACEGGHKLEGGGRLMEAGEARADLNDEIAQISERGAG